jgi:hypothetical protein
MKCPKVAPYRSGWQLQQQFHLTLLVLNIQNPQVRGEIVKYDNRNGVCCHGAGTSSFCPSRTYRDRAALLLPEY